MTISVNEIIALLKRTNPANIDEIKAFDFTSPQAKPFIKFCEAVYQRGFNHGEQSGREDGLVAMQHAKGASDLDCWQSRDAGIPGPICEPCNTGNRDRCLYKQGAKRG